LTFTVKEIRLTNPYSPRGHSAGVLPGKGKNNRICRCKRSVWRILPAPPHGSWGNPHSVRACPRGAVDTRRRGGDGGGGRSLRHKKKITIDGVKTLERNQASFEAPPPRGGGGRCSDRGGGGAPTLTHTQGRSLQGEILKMESKNQRHFCVWFTALGQPKEVGGTCGR